MAIYFPQINGDGIITQRPYTSALSYNTSTNVLPCGKQLAWGWYGTGLTNFPAKPLGKFTVTYQAITDAELAVVRAFFDSMKGRYGEFTFLDPSGNLVFDSEDFSQWSGYSTGTPGQSDPFGGTNAMTVAASSIYTPLSKPLLPAGHATVLLNFSVWVKALTTNTQFDLGYADHAFGFYIYPQVQRLPVVVGQWVRVDYAITIDESTCADGLWMKIAFNHDVQLFGAQCAPLPGPGMYARTPGRDALHPKCRFDTDLFNPRYVGPNQITLTLPIQEYF